MLTRLLVVALLTALAACAGDADAAYCDELAGARDDLVALAERTDEAGEDYLASVLDLFERLRREAPPGLRDEWDTVAFAWQDLVDIFEETGVDPATFDPAKRPEGLTRQEFDRIRAVGDELRSPRVRDAVEGITRHAQDVCDVTLDL